MNLPDRTLSVVGAKFELTRKIEIEECTPGEFVELRPEPKNKHDPNAIAVFSCRGIQLGYLRAEDAPRIGQIMNQTEVQAVFQQETEWGCYIRAAFDGSTLDLPQSIERDDDLGGDPDFWPDPEWPDE